MGEEVKEIRQPPIGGGRGWGDTHQLVSSGQNQHYITIYEIIFARMFGTMRYLSQNNK